MAVTTKEVEMSDIKTEVSISFDGKFRHVRVVSGGENEPPTTVDAIAATREAVLEENTKVTEWIMRDRESWVRVPPEIVTETDFDTKITGHRAFSRFSFMDRMGEKRQIDREDKHTSLGSAS